MKFWFRNPILTLAVYFSSNNQSDLEFYLFNLKLIALISLTHLTSHLGYGLTYCSIIIISTSIAKSMKVGTQLSKYKICFDFLVDGCDNLEADFFPLS